MTTFGQSIIQQCYVFLQSTGILWDSQLIGKSQGMLFRTFGQTCFQQMRDWSIHTFFPTLRKKKKKEFGVKMEMRKLTCCFTGKEEISLNNDTEANLEN